MADIGEGRSCRADSRRLACCPACGAKRPDIGLIELADKEEGEFTDDDMAILVSSRESRPSPSGTPSCTPTSRKTINARTSFWPCSPTS